MPACQRLGRPRQIAEFSVTTSVHVAAPPAEVFSYFTDPARYVRWMGAQAGLDPVPGGEYRVRMGDGFEAAGEFTELDPWLTMPPFPLEYQGRQLIGSFLATVACRPAHGDGASTR